MGCLCGILKESYNLEELVLGRWIILKQGNAMGRHILDSCGSG
jgi:hypothetical protein